MSGVRNRVGKLLSERGLTMYEVSRESGVSRPAIANYVKNPKYTGTVDTLDRIAGALNVKLWDLLEGESVVSCDCARE